MKFELHGSLCRPAGNVLILLTGAAAIISLPSQAVAAAPVTKHSPHARAGYQRDVAPKDSTVFNLLQNITTKTTFDSMSSYTGDSMHYLRKSRCSSPNPPATRLFLFLHPFFLHLMPPLLQVLLSLFLLPLFLPS